MFRNTFDHFRLLSQNSLLQHSGIGTVKGKISGKHFIGHHSQSILICGGTLGASAPLFRSHIRTGSAGSAIGLTYPGHGSADLSSQTEIENFNGAVICDHDISRLDIPVHHSFFMSIVQCFSDLSDNRDDFIKCKLTFSALLFDPAAQIFAFTALHDQIVVSVPFIPFQSFGNGNILMNQFCNELEIIFDILHFQGIMRQIRRKNFQSNFNPGSFIKTFIDNTHAASAEFSKNFVTVQDQIADPESFIQERSFLRSGRKMTVFRFIA